jgi:hypothetical protein
VDGTGSGSYPVVNVGIGSVKTSSSTTEIWLRDT